MEWWSELRLIDGDKHYMKGGKPGYVPPFDATPDEASLVACHAKSHTGEVHRFVARTSTEVHGGMGFTDLLGLHFWFKRIGFDRQVLGGPEAVRAEAAALQGWTQVA